MESQRSSLADPYEQAKPLSSRRSQIVRKPVLPKRPNEYELLEYQQKTENGWRISETGSQGGRPLPPTSHKAMDVFLKADDYWWIELLAAIFGGALVVAIAILLKYYDGKPIPNWSVSLTSIVVILTTIAKSSLLLAVTTAISQQKWFWYKQRNQGGQLFDMQVFDRASRGPWGSFLLIYTMLFKWRKWSIASIGGIIILLSILFDFAGQQALGFEVSTSFVNSSDTTVRRMQSFQDQTHMDDSRLGFRNPLARAVTLGVLASTGMPQLQPSCPTSECNWPIFSSLGVCNSCIDISAQVKSTQNCNTQSNNFNLWCVIDTNSTGSQNLTFGYSGNGPPSYFNATVYKSANSWPSYDSIFGGSKFAGVDYPIYAFQGFDYKISQLTTNTFQYNLLAAVECSFYTCIKTYDISTKNGASEQNVISTWHNESLEAIHNLFPVHGTFSPDLYLDPPSNETHSPGLYKMQGTAMSTIAGSLDDCFTDVVTLSDTDNLSTESTSSCPQWIYSDGNVTQSAQNIALSLTDYIQTSNGSEVVTGTHSVVANHVRFRWPWLLLPFALSTLSLVFLVFTIIESKRDRDLSWKASSMALLYHCPDAADLLAKNDLPLNTLSEMEARAKMTGCRLENQDGQAWKFSFN